MRLTTAVKSNRKKAAGFLACTLLFTVYWAVEQAVSPGKHFLGKYAGGERVLETSPEAKHETARHRYQLWDRWNTLDLTDAPADPGKFLIYRCPPNRACGGWADRLKGIMMGYILANLTRRTFKVQLEKPACNITDFLVPNAVDWTWKAGDKDSPDSSATVSLIDNANYTHNVSILNFTNLIPKNVSKVYFLGNLYYLTGLRDSTSQELAWMTHLAPADVYAVLYKRLFKLSEKLQRFLDVLLDLYLPNASDKLYCAHVRLGINPSVKDDTEVRNTLDNVKNVWEFLKSKTSPQSNTVFVMSDSAEVITASRMQSFLGHLLLIPGQIVHVDKSRGMSEWDRCEGLKKVILEHHLLMNCDVLVRGNSGISTLAAAVRGLDQDLFCFRRNGRVEPCSRNDFKL